MIRTCSYPKDYRGLLMTGLALLILAPHAAWGQWTTESGGTIYYYGNVGIGTTSPRSAIPGWPSLDLGSGGLFFGNYNVGGVSFASTATWPANGGLIAWNKINYAGETSLINFSGGPGNDGGFSFWDRDTFLMRITKAGNVGIGMALPPSKLAVNGTITAKDVMVTNTGWPDNVFRPGYRLRPLSEVSQYIQTKGHLPDIPTEVEVKEKGVSLGDMQAKLLAKVEELTLHMIQENERGNRLEKQNEELRQEIRHLRKQLKPGGAFEGASPFSEAGGNVQ